MRKKAYKEGEADSDRRKREGAPATRRKKERKETGKKATPEGTYA